jgi:tetratricopeptide (TPR) repeat protein
MLRPLPALVLAALVVARPAPARSDIAETLAQARERLERGQAEDAVAALEAALPTVPQDRLAELLDVLRVAYEAAIRRAEAEGRPRDAALLRDNLAIIAGSPSGRPTVAEPPEPPRSPEAAPAPSAQEEAKAKTAEPQEDSALSLDNEPPRTGEALEAPEPPPTHDLAAADAAFRAKRYTEAGRIYAELARQGRLPEVRRDPWAYCRMVGVVERINAGAKSEAEWTEIRAEIDAIRKLSPKNWYGEYLRNLVAELTASGRRGRDSRPVLRGASPEEKRPEGASSRPAPDQTRTRRFVAAGSSPEAQPTAEPPAGKVVGRAGPPIGNWKVWETDNFRILHADEALARRVAQAAEASRDEQARRWIGPKAPGPWSPRCDIYLYPTAALFSQMTGQPQDSPGFSTMGLSGGQVVARRVNLRADHPNLLTAVLPHEVTHVVLADVFRDVQVPRWADEGMAVLSEPKAEQELRAADLTKPLADNRLFRLADLMSMDYPDGRYWSLYYAQSVSLTRFLVEQGTPAQFVEFVRGAQRAGVEAELRRVYGIQDLADLQARWLAYARGRSEQLAAAERPGATR